jgi:hypothetical protein
MLFRRNRRQSDTSVSAMSRNTGKALTAIATTTTTNSTALLNRTVPQWHHHRQYHHHHHRSNTKSILRIASVDDSLHTVYGAATSGAVVVPPNDDDDYDNDIKDSSLRSIQSDDQFVLRKQYQRRQQERLNNESQRSVLFSAIEIREYNRIVGDNPSCSSGPPVS